MATKSNYVGRKIPNLTTRKSAPVTTNFAKGIKTYKPNDTMDETEVRLAQDARFDRVGEYGTRKGFKAISANIIGLGTIGDYCGAMSYIPYITKPQGKTITADARICGYRFKAKAIGSPANFPIMRFTLSINGNVVDSTCFDATQLTNTITEYDVIFNSAPDVKENDVVTIAYDYQDKDTTVVGTNYILISSGWNYDEPEGLLLTCTAGGVSSIFEANIGGTKTILFVQNNTLYRMAADGTVTTIRALTSGAGTVRFSQNLDQIRYVCGSEVPHILDPSSSWTDTAMDVEDLKTETTLNITMRNIMPGPADNMIYMVSDPDTEVIWTYPYGFSYAKSPAFSTTSTINGNPGDTLTIQSTTITPSGIAIGDWITGQGSATAEVTAISGTTVSLTIVDTTPQTISSYDKFNVDYYQNLPAIKTGDPLTAMFNLAGVLYFQTRRNKYQMYMQSADSWTQAASNAQGGTFSQESIVCDLNYAYFANDNGVYIFDGSSEQSLTENTIQNVYDAITGKESIRLDLFKNRLYVFYSSNGDGINDSCLVYNVNLHVWESFDANTYVGATSARQNASGRFLCGHSRIGLIMQNEADDGDYSNLGQPLAFNLETAYEHFGTTSQLKRITKWRPEFATSERDYSIACGYALDFTDEVQYAFSVDLKNQTTVTESYIWDNPSDYGVPTIPTVHTTEPQVNGEFYRCQLRYQHIGAFEPVIFRSHTLTVQTQRIR